MTSNSRVENTDHDMGSENPLLAEKAFRYLLTSFIILIYLLCAPSDAWAAKDNSYAIQQVRDNVYRFTAGNYHSVFMVSDDQIVVTDPINSDAAKWLSKQLQQRFSKPVTYMIYSHNHPDHTCGGEVFADAGTTIVSQRLARQDLEHTRAKTALPTLVFNQSMTLYVGDNQIHLQYHGRNNGRGSISMQFEPAGVMHVVDWIVLGRMPYKTMPGYDIEGMIQSTEAILKKDFDVFVGGHAETGNKQDVRDYLGYLNALYDAVRDGMLAGQSLTQLQESIHLDKYAHLKNYTEWLPLNIEGVYHTLEDQSYLLMRPEVKQID